MVDDWAIAMESTLGLSGRLCTVPGSKHALFESGDLESTSVVIFVGEISSTLSRDSDFSYSYALKAVFRMVF